MALRIPGWSLFLGLPAVQIGIIFIIFTFDEVAREKGGVNSLYMISCSICKKPILVHTWEEEKICQECLRKMAKKMKLSKD